MQMAIKDTDAEDSGPKVTRRGLLQAFGLSAMGAGMAGLDGFLLEPRWLDVTFHTSHIAGLSRNLEGLKIAQISDLHFRQSSSLHGALAKSLDAENPSLVAFTGDLVDKQHFLPGLLEFLSSLKAPGRQILATLGNWEHWAGFTAAGLAGEYKRAGVQLMVNEETRAENGLMILATDDVLYSRTNVAEMAKRRGPKKEPLLLLTHSPSILDMPDWGPGFWDLALAGHTHGGQARLGPYIPFLPPESGRFVNGWYQTASGPAYVSKGVGTTIMEVRFTCRPELAYFTLARG